MNRFITPLRSLTRLLILDRYGHIMVVRIFFLLYDFVIRYYLSMHMYVGPAYFKVHSHTDPFEGII